MTLNRWWFAAAGMGLALAVIIGMAYTGNLPGHLLGLVPYSDKMLHFLLIGGAAYVLHRALARKTVSILGFAAPLGPLIIAVATFVEECIQMASPHRSFSFGDMAANVLGIVFFTALDAWMVRRKAMAEARVTRAP